MRNEARLGAVCRAMLLALACVLSLAPAAAAQEKIKVVATFSILADLVRNVGGDRVDVISLVGPNGDAHVYTPTPADARLVGAARLVVVNGLGFEGWISRLVTVSNSKAAVMVASRSVKARRDGGGHGHGHDDDPHAWQSVPNVMTYVANIRDALTAADPAGKAVYEANAAAYRDKLAALDAEIRAAVAQIPPERRRVITSHDSFGYFADTYGVAFVAPRGVSTEAQASARDVARIITQVKQQNIPAVFLENITDQRMMQRIAEETGARIGGGLISDALTDGAGVAPTYVDLMRHNVKQLAAALAK
jgi:zinc/manganese transport system substrate-binding protein